ncbi:uncharacterized protein LOC143040669 [Oratosquilla oratoria]|uniref:uncharacterized protein LOC143040669 n=1 Tax=Oratosquilla oratoria TaxID=337810 RepID=UPI003F76A547
MLFFFHLVFLAGLLAGPKSCHANECIDKSDLANLIQQVLDSTGAGEDQQVRLAAAEASLGVMQSSVSILVSENALLKAKVDLLEKKVLQMEAPDTSLVAPPEETPQRNVSTYAKESPACESPFVDVFGRCVFVERTTVGAWTSVRQVCVALGADLVIVDSADFMWHLIRHLEVTNLNDVDYWVGAWRETFDGKFKWVDNTPVHIGTPYWGYFSIGEGLQPYDDNKSLHICMHRLGYYFMHSCHTPHQAYGICQRKRERT